MADLSSLLQLGQQMQGRLTEIQSQLAQQTVTVSAGGGMVQATADGRGQIRAITIAPEVVRQGDVECSRAWCWPRWGRCRSGPPRCSRPGCGRSPGGYLSRSSCPCNATCRPL